jgi:hypothetical protein
MLFRLLGWRGRQQRRKQAGGKFTPVSHRFLFALKRRIYVLSFQRFNVCHSDTFANRNFDLPFLFFRDAIM